MKIIIQYMLMVVGVLVGIYLVLRLGETLSAPASIHGVWRLDESSAANCPVFSDWEDPTLMDISQSGVYLDVQVGGKNGVRLNARLQADRVLANTPVGFTLALDRGAEPHRLSGELRLAGCSQPLVVQYTQQPAVQSTSGGMH